MQSIITKYIGASNFRPSRIVVWSTGNPKSRKTFSYEHGVNADANHRAAAAWLATERKWEGQWVQGSLDNSSYIFVAIKGADTFTVEA